MELDTETMTPLLAALGLARERGGAVAALQDAGIDLATVARLSGVQEDIDNVLGQSSPDLASEALALGFLAGRLGTRRPARTPAEPTSFLMDHDLVVKAATGQSILRLPWFDEELFVGRQLPDIREMPTTVRRLCIESYSAALAGERGVFAFRSYGHAYTVDALPVRNEDGRVAAVLGVARPAPSFASAAGVYERAAERLERSAMLADTRADGHRAAGRDDAEALERTNARRARDASERARANARSLSSRAAAAGAEPPDITQRETDVLTLASHGLTYEEIGEQLCISPSTVRTHLQNVYPKLGAKDKAAAVAAAMRHGLIA
jgi:DNA-binding CsgD family transcriptional regulator